MREGVSPPRPPWMPGASDAPPRRLLPLAKATGVTLMQARPGHERERLEKALRAVADVDGLLEARSAHFWMHTPGSHCAVAPLNMPSHAGRHRWATRQVSWSAPSRSACNAQRRSKTSWPPCTAYAAQWSRTSLSRCGGKRPWIARGRRATRASCQCASAAHRWRPYCLAEGGERPRLGLAHAAVGKWGQLPRPSPPRPRPRPQPQPRTRTRAWALEQELSRLLATTRRSEAWCDRACSRCDVAPRFRTGCSRAL